MANQKTDAQQAIFREIAPVAEGTPEPSGTLLSRRPPSETSESPTASPPPAAHGPAARRSATDEGQILNCVISGAVAGDAAKHDRQHARLSKSRTFRRSRTRRRSTPTTRRIRKGSGSSPRRSERPPDDSEAPHPDAAHRRQSHRSAANSQRAEGAVSGADAAGPGLRIQAKVSWRATAPNAATERTSISPTQLASWPSLIACRPKRLTRY